MQKHLFIHYFIIMLVLVCGGFGHDLLAQEQADLARHSLVRIAAVRQVPDYVQPWSPGQSSTGRGAGFVIDGELIMTNAHVVSNARFLMLKREGTPQRYSARVVHIAHDCDLALLAVNDKSFFEGMEALEFGDIPELESTVSAYGYPIGGSRMSVTRGVVSRIDYRTYAHSAADAHLTVQIDAAINPGNSGGPVMQEGKVVGVAFQGLKGEVAQNTGYMIPTPVVKRFLRDVEDGAYDGFVDLSISYSNLLNPAQRAALGLPDNNLGLLVGTVLPQGSCDGILKAGDVLLKIDGHPIYSDGYVKLDGDLVLMPEVVERKLKGEKVRFTVFRGRKEDEVEVTLKPGRMSESLAIQYDEDPRYVICAGIIFQPMDRNFMMVHKPQNLTARHYFHSYVKDQLYMQRPEPVIISNLLPDPVNTYLRGFRHQLVDTINGRTIRNLNDVHDALGEDVEYHVIKTMGGGRPIVLEQAAVEEAKQRIQDRYGIASVVELAE